MRYTIMCFQIDTINKEPSSASDNSKRYSPAHYDHLDENSVASKRVGETPSKPDFI